MNLDDANPATLRQLWREQTDRLPANPYFMDVSAALLDMLYERFEESFILVRAFLAVPWQALPDRQRRFAADLSQSAGLRDQLNPQTPVVSLLASRGRAEEWNDPAKSSSHVAIPLLSDEFVLATPMISRLLTELGQSLTWKGVSAADFEGRAIGSEVGYFYVNDARRALDEFGRKIITAQDFVEEYGVRSVFAIGGLVYGGNLNFFIFFCERTIEPRTARAFMPLVSEIKGTLISRCSMSRIFRPDDTADHRDRHAPAVTPGGVRP